MYQINSCIKQNNEIINSEFKLIDRNSAYRLNDVRQEIHDSPILSWNIQMHISHINELKHSKKILNFH